MKFSLLSVATRNLNRKTFRTAVLITSIGLLVATLVFGISFLISVSSTLERAANRLGADLLVVPMGARDYAEEVLLETKAKVFYMDEGIIEKVKNIEGVEKVTHQTYLTTVFGLCCDIPPTTVVSFNQDTDFIVNSWLKKSIGRKLRKGEAIIGRVAGENLNLMDMTRSLLFGVEFIIVGVLEKTGTGLDNALFMSDENIDDVISRGKAGLKPNEISLIFAKVTQGFDPYEVGRTIEGKIVEVDTIERNDMGKRIITSLNDIKSLFLITITLATVLSAFLAWTVFSAIVSERSREVSVMKAIGAKGSHILTMFIFEVMILGVLGSLLGIGLGIYLSYSLSNIFSLFQDVDITLTVIERMEIGLIGFLAGTGICIIGSLSPIIRIKKLDPYASMKEA
jgi:putative ABC transport system permease protein